MNIKKTIGLAVLMLLLPFASFAQGHFDWVKSYSGPDKSGDLISNRIIQTEIDSEGNLYVFSQCSGSASINGIPLVDHPELNQYYNVIIMKFSSTGDIVWRKSISSQTHPSYGHCMRLVGDTMVVILASVPLEGRIYFIDSLYTNARTQLFTSDSMRSVLGVTYVSLDSNGGFKEHHFVQIAKIDNHGDLITMDRELHDPRYEGKVLPTGISSWPFGIDGDGNIIIQRPAVDFVDIKTGAIDSMGYNVMDRYSIENGLLSGLQIWVDGHGRFDIYPQNQPKMWNLMLMKFSPHFDDLLGYQYLFTDEQVESQYVDNCVPRPHDLYIDSSNNIYVIEHLIRATDQPLSARLAGSSQVLGRGSCHAFSFLVKCSSDLRPIFLQQFSVEAFGAYDGQLYFSSISANESDHQLFVSGYRMNAVDYDYEGNMLGYLNPNPILTDSGDTIQALNDAFFIRYNLETGAYMSSGIVNSHISSYSVPVAVIDGIQICYDKNRLFVPIQYKDSVFAGADTASVGSNMYGCGVYVWDANGHDIGFISIGTESAQRQGILVLSLKDSSLYISGELTQSSADLGDHHLAYNGRSVAFVSCYTDTAFMTPYVYNDTTGNGGGNGGNGDDTNDVRIVMAEDGNAFVAYPNPFRQRVNIEYSGQQPITAAYLTDIMGRTEQVVISTNGNGRYTLDLTARPQAAYLLTLVTQDGHRHTVRLLKQSEVFEQ